MAGANQKAHSRPVAKVKYRHLPPENTPSPESQSQLPQRPALNSSSRIASPTPPPQKAKFEVTACTNGTNRQGEVTAFNLWPKILKDWFANKKQMKIKNKKKRGMLMHVVVHFLQKDVRPSSLLVL